MPRYELLVTGEEQSGMVKELPLLLTGEGFRAAFVEPNECHIEWDQLNQFDGDDFVLAADKFVSTLRALLLIYHGGGSDLKLKGWIVMDEMGNMIRSAAPSPKFTLSVITPQVLDQLKTLDADGNTGFANMLREIERNDKLISLLHLVGDEPLRWPRLYDVLEAFGGTNKIMHRYKKNVDSKVLAKMNATAGRRRHPAKSSQPVEKGEPHLAEAIGFVIGLLRLHLLNHVQSGPKEHLNEIPSVSIDIVVLATATPPANPQDAAPAQAA